MNSFAEVLKGPLYGVMSWDQWDTLQTTMINTRQGGWYVYYVGEAVPTYKQTDDSFDHIVKEIDQLLRRDHDEAYLGIVYTDHFDTPTLVKIYDPNNLGASCGSSGIFVPPGWVISKMPPVEIQSPIRIPQGRKRWWNNLFTFQSSHHSPS